MGTSRTPFEFAVKCAEAGEASRHAAKVGTEAGALFTKRTIVALAPSRLSGVGKKGVRLGVRYNVGEYPDGAKALVYATGPWQLIERDTKPHQIPRQRARGRRRYAVIGGQPYSRVHHPGTKGKHPFEKGVAIAVARLPEIYASARTAHLAAIFH